MARRQFTEEPPIAEIPRAGFTIRVSNRKLLKNDGESNAYCVMQRSEAGNVIEFRRGHDLAELLEAAFDAGFLAGRDAEVAR